MLALLLSGAAARAEPAPAPLPVPPVAEPAPAPDQASAPAAEPPAPAPALPPPGDAPPPPPAPVEPATAAAATPPPPVLPDRPKLELAVGMGASIDDAGLTEAGLSAIPAFFAMGGFGDGAVGLDFGAFVNSANGRYRSPNTPVDRLAFDGMVVVRPGASKSPSLPVPGYLRRVLGAAALDIGLGYERSSRIARSAESVTRLGVRIGAHLDLPLSPAPAPGAGGGELRLRLAVRRMMAFSTH